MRKAIQEEGMKDARKEAYKILHRSSVPVNPQTIILAELIAEAAYTRGVEAMADAIQPEFLQLTTGFPV